MQDCSQVMCPFCGQRTEVDIEGCDGSQRVVTDCEVCCRPFEVVAECEGGEILSLDVLGG